MLKTIDLLESLNLIDREQYGEMIKKVNIPDFTKCIAQFSGLDINDVSEDVITQYLKTWAKNKYKYFKMLGNKLYKDIDFEYNHIREEIENEIEDISKDFPVYSYWLENFKDQRHNKIDNMRDFPYNFSRKLDKYFPQYKIIGSTITHFFKSCLKAPDELITRVAAIFENEKVKAKYTISIDPVDMMLASENPYNWQSCYRLETPNSSSHADGCLAAILDSSSLITYVWNREGKFKLYNKYDFKNIRYKRMRQWISIAPEFNAIHFNEIYPGKNYGEEFDKQLREIVENVVCNYTKAENRWKKGYDCDCDREYETYGYSEYNSDYIYKLSSEAKYISWNVYDEAILCPCGCGKTLIGSYEPDFCDEEVEYNGEGFIAENFEEKYWCNEADDYCTYGYHNCEECNETECWAWRNAHPVCELDEDHECEDPDSWYIDDGIMSCSKDHCCNCPFYKEHHQDNNENDDE